MNPLELIVESSKRVTPTIFNHEIGSDIESVLYHVIKSLKPEYKEFVIISFSDAYASIIRYLESVYEDADEIFKKGAKLISVVSFFEENLGQELLIQTKDPELIVGRIKTNLGTKNNTLFLVLGLDIFGVRYPGELVMLLPGLIRVLGGGKNNNIIITFNFKAFPENITEIVNSFALNLFKFGVDVKGSEIKRKLTVIRSVFVEYNLKSWYYTVYPELRFFPIG
ncbi:hypothetical protein [Pyrococcus horikoshii]|uniref:KaiC-like domain-containing protein n=1 Tax=Pyrococcus horikoshii TaxID=53953 RepID=A0A832WKH3_PYRHR|nr:hypothetical protein [Pyrococcus horikoshii]HII61309.1 hypothetical protein [Pyrococcus horikoshii]